MPNITSKPLSPHLQIYRYTILMTMSIMHRLTGVALYGGMLLFTLWFLALALGKQYYALFSWFIHSYVGLIILFGFSWCMFHHMLGGIRHLIWDSVTWIDVVPARRLAWANIILSLTLTALLWGVGFYAHGL